MSDFSFIDRKLYQYDFGLLCMLTICSEKHNIYLIVDKRLTIKEESYYKMEENGLKLINRKVDSDLLIKAKRYLDSQQDYWCLFCQIPKEMVNNQLVTVNYTNNNIFHDDRKQRIAANDTSNTKSGKRTKTKE